MHLDMDVELVVSCGCTNKTEYYQTTESPNAANVMDAADCGIDEIAYGYGRKQFMISNAAGMRWSPAENYDMPIDR